MSKKRSLINGRYFISKKWINCLLGCFDAVLLKIVSVSRNRLPCLDVKPKKILITNGAHLGDVLMASSVLPVLANNFPSAKFGLLIGSWSKPVLEGHPLIEKVHFVDHWMLNRSSESKVKKIIRYMRSRNRALSEIIAEKYDFAVDLHFFIPNSALLLWQAKIPVRVGFRSSGFGPLYTHSRDWGPGGRRVIDHYKDLLGIVPFLNVVSELWPSLPPIDDAISFEDIRPGNFIVLHPGAGSVHKEWPIDKWCLLAKALIEDGNTVVVSGGAGRDIYLAKKISDFAKGTINLAGKLEWARFVALLSKAKAVIGVDSVAGHISSALSVPTVVISHGMSDPELWRPVGRTVKVINPVECSPCFRKAGCKEMTCITGVSISEVIGHTRDIIFYNQR